ncbi:hypothetical protein HDV62DRAFT_1485 [Trichoderma sp. SZMC 28011]
MPSLPKSFLKKKKQNQGKPKTQLMQPPSCSNTPVLLVSNKIVFFFSSLFYCVFVLSVVLSWNRPAAATARDEARAGRHNLHHRSRYFDETSHLCACRSQYLSHPF